MNRIVHARLVVLACLVLTASVWPSGDLHAATFPAIAGDFYLLEPCRVYDSRSGAPLRNGTEILVPFFGICEVPSTARAVVISMTVIGPVFGSGDLTMYPANFPNPGVGTIYFDFSRSRFRCNNAVQMLSTNGTGSLRVRASMTPGGDPFAHLVIDITGYFE